MTSNQNPLQIGAFSGYNRRPQPDKQGMTAQFYGENGDDADIISALSLTKFLDADVFVKVFLIKDAVGQLMKTKSGYPVIAAFKAKIQRPKGLSHGMIANLFATNGEDADSVNNLGLSKYLDSFVYVEILKPEAAPTPAPQPEAQPAETGLDTTLDAISKQLTPHEKKLLQKQTKAFGEANKLLKMSGFLKNNSVWSCLGNELDFQTWIEKTPCCAPGNEPCTQQSTPFKIPGESYQRYSLIPLCPMHAKEAESAVLPGGIAFLRMRRDILIQEWAWELLQSKTEASPLHGHEPDPQKVMSWALENKLTQFIPGNYLGRVRV